MVVMVVVVVMLMLVSFRPASTRTDLVNKYIKYKVQMYGLYYS